VRDLKILARNVFVDVRNLKIVKCLNKQLLMENSLDMTKFSTLQTFDIMKTTNTMSMIFITTVTRTCLFGWLCGLLGRIC